MAKHEFQVGNTYSKGRKPGSKNRSTLAREAAQAKALKIMLEEYNGTEMPKDFMLRIMRCCGLPLEQRFAAARSAAPYCHPQLQAVADQMLDASGQPLNVCRPHPIGVQ